VTVVYFLNQRVAQAGTV